MVNQVVMRKTEEHEVVHVRESAVGPFDDVMGLGPAWGPVTAREPAAPVADDEGFVLGVAGEASAATEIQDLARTLKEHGGDVGVAGGRLR